MDAEEVRVEDLLPSDAGGLEESGSEGEERGSEADRGSLRGLLMDKGLDIIRLAEEGKLEMKSV